LFLPQLGRAAIRPNRQTSRWLAGGIIQTGLHREVPMADIKPLLPTKSIPSDIKPLTIERAKEFLERATWSPDQAVLILVGADPYSRPYFRGEEVSGRWLATLLWNEVARLPTHPTALPVAQWLEWAKDRGSKTISHAVAEALRQVRLGNNVPLFGLLERDQGAMAVVAVIQHGELESGVCRPSLADSDAEPIHGDLLPVMLMPPACDAGAPKVEVSDPKPRPAATGPEFMKKRDALIKDHTHEWPSIKGDLSDASDNGLSRAAKVPGQHGMWFVERARVWARERGKLSEPKALATLSNSMFDLPGKRYGA